MLVQAEMEMEIQKLSDEFKMHRWKTDKHFDKLEKRITGMWWKMGVLAGVLSVVVGQIFGTGVVAAIAPLLDGFGL